MLDAKRREENQFLDMLRIQSRISAHDIPPERVCSQIKLSQVHLLAPVLKSLQEEVVCLFRGLGGEGWPATCAHADDVKGYQVEVFGKRFERLVEKQHASVVAMGEDQGWLGALGFF